MMKKTKTKVASKAKAKVKKAPVAKNDFMARMKAAREATSGSSAMPMGRGGKAKMKKGMGGGGYMKKGKKC